MTSSTTNAPTGQATVRSGRFDGVEVHVGPGGGLASAPVPRPGTATATYYHAARIDDIGDAVLAVTRVLDPVTAALTGLELRAFTAAAPGRGVLAAAGEEQLLAAPGAIAFAQLQLASPGDAADERRTVELRRCVVTDAPPTAAAAERVAHWLRTTWELELVIGSWPAIRGTLSAFATSGGEPADWARTWLAASEHRVDVADSGPSDGDHFLKVFAATWLEAAPDA